MSPWFTTVDSAVKRIPVLIPGYLPEATEHEVWICRSGLMTPLGVGVLVGDAVVDGVAEALAELETPPAACACACGPLPQPLRDRATRARGTTRQRIIR